MLLCSLAHASPWVALSGVPVCTGAHSRGGGVHVPAVFCPPPGLDLPRLGPSAAPGVGPHSSACVAHAVWGWGCAALPPPPAYRGPLTDSSAPVHVLGCRLRPLGTPWALVGAPYVPESSSA